MLKRSQIGSVVFVTPSLLPETLLPVFKDAQLIFQGSHTMPIIHNYEQVLVPPEHCNISVFYDDLDEHVYLTNFVYDQTVLDDPVDLIVVFRDDVQIYVGRKQLVLLTAQMHPDVKRESFYFELYGTVAPTACGSKRKVFIESNNPIGDDGESLELGVHSALETTLSASEAIPDSPPSASMGPEQVCGDLYPAVVHEIQLPTAIQSTGLDRKKKREDTLKLYKLKADNILKSHKIKNNEIPVSPDQLILTRSFKLVDSTIQRIFDSFDKTNPSLSDPDPIVVCEVENGEYKVLSGNRRVAACQKKMMKKIYVSKIEVEESDSYAMKHYFVSQTKEDHNIKHLIFILKTLLIAMDLTEETLFTWTTAEKTFVFGSLFGPMTKLRFLLDFMPEKPLMNEIIRLNEDGIIFSNHTFREIQRRQRQNPQQISDLMKQNWESDIALRKEISKVSIDLRFKLVQKKVSNSVANELCDLYHDNEMFEEFVRASDLRNAHGNSQKQLIISQFEKFRSSRRKRPADCILTTVRLSQVTDVFEVLITTSEASATSILSNQDSVLTLIIGTFSSSINSHLLLLPDKFGQEDETGRLTSHISVTLFIKTNGEILDGRQITDFLSSHGTTNRSILNTDELRTLLRFFTHIKIEFDDVLTEDLGILLFAEGSTITVDEKKHLKRLEKLLHSSQT